MVETQSTAVKFLRKLSSATLAVYVEEGAIGFYSDVYANHY